MFEEHITNPLDYVRLFVEGKLSPTEFAQVLYTDGELEEVMRRAPPIPPYSTSTARNLFQFLIERNYLDQRDVRNAQDVAALFLDCSNIKYARDGSLAHRRDLIDSVQPKWLSIDDNYLQSLLKAAGPLRGEELREWLKAEIPHRFRSVGKPPRWLQSPQWPIRDGTPLIFLGQVGIGEILHDEGQVYVFMVSESEEIVTILQVA